MQKINFEQTIKLIHKEINVKLVKANKELFIIKFFGLVITPFSQGIFILIFQTFI